MSQLPLFAKWVLILYRGLVCSKVVLYCIAKIHIFNDTSFMALGFQTFMEQKTRFPFCSKFIISQSISSSFFLLAKVGT